MAEARGGRRAQGADADADLGVLPGPAYTDSYAYAINSRGQVAGISSVVDPSRDRAFRTSATGTLANRGADLGAFPGGGDSWAHAINSRGQVAGWAQTTGGRHHAFRTSATGTVAAPGADLGALPGYPNSEADGINSRGQVVGHAYAVGSHDSERDRAFVYDDAARPRLHDLNSLIPAHSGVVLEQANGINDAGQIAATGTIHVHTHAFRLTPRRR